MSDQVDGKRSTKSSRPLLMSNLEAALPRQEMDEENTAIDEKKSFKTIADSFDTLGQVTKAIKDVGVHECGVIFGIDYTMSNRVQGRQTFNGLSLHDLSGQRNNPYQEVICILGETLEPFDDDGIIPAFGFGDRTVKDQGIFPLKADGECDGFQEVLDEYNRITPTIKLGGPTNFVPIIEEAINIVKKTKQYHILAIVADGQVSDEQANIEAIVRASKFPLSIIVIGVGDGPWEVMYDFDDRLPERTFDNFQFVNFNEVKSNARNPQAAVALAALMEIPDQYKFVKESGMLGRLKAS